MRYDDTMRQWQEGRAARYAASLRRWMQRPGGPSASALAQELGVSVSMVRHLMRPEASGRPTRMPSESQRARIEQLGGPAATVAGLDGW